MVRVSSPAKLRPWSELTAKMVMGVVPGLVIKSLAPDRNGRIFLDCDCDRISIIGLFRPQLAISGETSSMVKAACRCKGRCRITMGSF